MVAYRVDVAARLTRGLSEYQLHLFSAFDSITI